MRHPRRCSPARVQARCQADASGARTRLDRYGTAAVCRQANGGTRRQSKRASELEAIISFRTTRRRQGGTQGKAQPHGSSRMQLRHGTTCTSTTFSLSENYAYVLSSLSRDGNKKKRRIWLALARSTLQTKRRNKSTKLMVDSRHVCLCIYASRSHSQRRACTPFLFPFCKARIGEHLIA